MKIVQLGACKGNDHVTELVKSRNDVEFLLLVEPNPKVYQSLKECYDFFPNTIIEKLAIVPDYTRGKDVEMFFSEADSTWGYQVTSLYKNHVIKHYAYQQDSIESFFVKSITLEDLFEKHNILDLDYLFVDIEGMDEDVILNFDLNKYNIKNICVEYIHLKNPDELYSFLNKHGYREQNGIVNMYDKMFSKNTNKFNGGRIALVGNTVAGQTPKALEQFYKILKDFDTIIEIGYNRGGLTLWFNENKKETAELFAYDISDGNREVFNKRINFIVKDCFSMEAIEEIEKRIQTGGKTMVFCDGGNKTKEFNLFSMFLKQGDVILLNDYLDGTLPEPYNSFKESQGWSHAAESTYSSIEDAIRNNNLQKYLYDDFRKVLIGCFIKQ